MNTDPQSPSGAAPARARSNENADANLQEPSGPLSDPQAQDEPRNLDHVPFRASAPSGSDHRKSLPDDLRVPWGWADLLAFVVLILVAGVIVTRGVAWIAVRFFGVKPAELFTTNITTAMSIVALVSQALVDAGALLLLYLLLMPKMTGRFWPSIGWRETRPSMRRIRALVPQLLAGGAVLALIVSFVGAFFNTKETLPIEELLKARSSILLFGTLGVVVAPLVEETIFRGFLYPLIARWAGVVAGIVITGTLFGMMHAAQLWGGWGQIALLIFVGIVLTWVRARTGTVAASFFVHLGYNGLQLAGYLIYMVGRGHH